MKERLKASLGDLAQLWGASERMIENGTPLASDDAATIVSAINRIDSEEMTDVALNLRVARLTALDLRERDQLLVEASALHCWGSLSNRARRFGRNASVCGERVVARSRPAAMSQALPRQTARALVARPANLPPSPKRRARQKNIGHEINPWPAG
jgi:hypothetical protein